MEQNNWSSARGICSQQSAILFNSIFAALSLPHLRALYRAGRAWTQFAAYYQPSGRTRQYGRTQDVWNRTNLPPQQCGQTSPSHANTTYDHDFDLGVTLVSHLSLWKSATLSQPKVATTKATRFGGPRKFLATEAIQSCSPRQLRIAQWTAFRN